MKPIQYPYSKTSLIYTMLPTIIIIGSIPGLLKFIRMNDTTNWALILLFDFLFGLLLLYVIIKQFIPVIKGKIALELNSTSLISYIKDISIEWKDIEKIDLRNTQTSSYLYISFKWETDHGDHIRIPLGYIRGKDSDIYKTVIEYFKMGH